MTTQDEKRALASERNRRYRERHREKCKAYAEAYRARHRKTPTPMPQTKPCAHCLIVKPRDQFSPRTKFKGMETNRGALGVDAICRACRSHLRKPSLATERAAKAALAAAGLKRCGTCRRVKPLSRFHIRRASRDRFAYCCIACVTKRSTAWRKTHPQAFSEWREQNKEYSRQRFKTWRDKNADSVRQNYREWARDNMGLVSANRRRRELSKLRATPIWADKSAIRAFYVEAARLTRVTGTRHDVDHIVPIRSRLVCGLHVACNLQILTRVDNQRKGNHHDTFLSWPA